MEHTRAQELERDPRVVYEDTFARGQPGQQWRCWPGFFGDNIEGGVDPSSPGRDSGVGVLRNARAGGFAALSYVARPVPADFDLSAWVFVTVSTQKMGALNGLAFRVDPEHERYYRFAARFTGEPTLSLAYVGRDARNYPAYLRVWHAPEIPGGVPRTSGWHQMGIRVRRDRAELSWDGARLPGGPFVLDRVQDGHAGVYATFTTGRGMAETRVDDFRVVDIGGEAI